MHSDTEATVIEQESEQKKWLMTDSFDKYTIEQSEDGLGVYVAVAGRGGLGKGLLPFIVLILLAAAVM